MKHEIMWWMSRLTIMLTSLFLSFSLAAQAYAADITRTWPINGKFSEAQKEIYELVLDVNKKT